MAINNFLAHIVHPDAQQYAEEHTSPQSNPLAQLERHTHLHTPNPHMLCGHFQGKLLEMVSLATQPQTILEIGTFVAYSTVCLCRGLRPNGTLHTIEVNEELEDTIHQTLTDNGLQNQVQLHIGNALDILPKLQNQHFDLALIDADKINYINYYQTIVPMMNTGGIILIDNVLWNGKVLYEQRSGDKETQTLKQLNNIIHTDPRVENLLLPVRDGLMICRKL